MNSSSLNRLSDSGLGIYLGLWLWLATKNVDADDVDILVCLSSHSVLAALLVGAIARLKSDQHVLWAALDGAC